MKKIFESPLNGWNESAERVYVYAFENDDEFYAFEAMSHQERCEYFNVFDETGYGVSPGGTYHTYEFHISGQHVIMFETIAINV